MITTTKLYLPRIFLIVCCGLLGYLMYSEHTIPTQSHIIFPEKINGEDIITLEEETLFITHEMILSGNSTSARPYIIRQLIAQGFVNFSQFPFSGTTGTHITSISMGNGYELLTPINATDDLDRYLETLDIGTGTTYPFFIPYTVRKEWGQVSLFKTTKDLQNMGYQVVSHRTRTNKDKDYRRFNIAQSFTLLGNVRILLPGEELDFMVDAQYDEYEKKNYVEGYSIIEGDEEKDYGGGICGASTAIYQGILTNTGLEITKLRNHSKWYSNLYTAYINHEEVATPGIDSAVYYGQIDLTMKNITPNPIILVMNYDGAYGSEEEVFTLSLPANLGAFEFVSGGKRRTTLEIDNPEGTGKIKQSVNAGGCYSRLINGEKETSCYKEVW